MPWARISIRNHSTIGQMGNEHDQTKKNTSYKNDLPVTEDKKEVVPKGQLHEFF